MEWRVRCKGELGSSPGTIGLIRCTAFVRGARLICGRSVCCIFRNTAKPHKAFLITIQPRSFFFSIRDCNHSMLIICVKLVIRSYSHVFWFILVRTVPVGIAPLKKRFHQGFVGCFGIIWYYDGESNVINFSVVNFVADVCVCPFSLMVNLNMQYPKIVGVQDRSGFWIRDCISSPWRVISAWNRVPQLRDIFCKGVIWSCWYQKTIITSVESQT